MAMTKATIIVAVDDPAEVASVEAWFSCWRERLVHVSENHGCGCCVDVWQVEGLAEAIGEIPPQAFVGNEWTH